MAHTSIGWPDAEIESSPKFSKIRPKSKNSHVCFWHGRQCNSFINRDDSNWRSLVTEAAALPLCHYSQAEKFLPNVIFKFVTYPNAYMTFPSSDSRSMLRRIYWLSPQQKHLGSNPDSGLFWFGHCPVNGASNPLHENRALTKLSKETLVGS